MPGAAAYRALARSAGRRRHAGPSLASPTRPSLTFAEIAAEIEPSLPHRNRALSLNRRLASRMLDAQEAWLDEVEAEFGAA